MKNFEQALDDLDLQLFEKIPSQSTEDDKQSLLACQQSGCFCQVNCGCKYGTGGFPLCKTGLPRYCTMRCTCG